MVPIEEIGWSQSEEIAHDLVFEKGHSLPAKATRTYYAAHALKRGQAGEFLRIPVVEGDVARGDRNKLVGLLDLPGEAISRNLPLGSAIEVAILVDESRIVTMQAYVPVLDMDFDGKSEMGTVTRKPAEIHADIAAEVARIQELKRKAAATGDREAGKLLAQIEQGQSLREVQELAATVADTDTAGKCESRLRELKSELDTAADTLEWPTVVAQAKEFIERLAALLEDDGTPEQKKEGQSVIADLRRIIEQRKPNDLKRKRAQGNSLYWRVVWEQAAFWVYNFQELEKDLGQLADPDHAARLFAQGRAYMSHNNATGLRNVVMELWKMLPDERIQEVNRGFQSGLRKAG